jgi:hypothetical protein
MIYILDQSTNISLSNHSSKSIDYNTTNDFDNPEIHAKLNHFIKWFTTILATFSLFIAVACPFLLWILQERCLSRSSINKNPRSTILITTPRLLLVDPRTNLQKSHTPSLHSTLDNSSNSSKQINSYHTPRTSSSSVNNMV